VYIDVVIKSKSKDFHLDRLRKAFRGMQVHGLKMNPLKHALGISAGEFLGFIVHEKEIEIDKNKVKVILETNVPMNKKQLQSLLGNINYLRRFI